MNCIYSQDGPEMVRAAYGVDSRCASGKSY